MLRIRARKKYPLWGYFGEKNTPYGGIVFWKKHLHTNTPRAVKAKKGKKSISNYEKMCTINEFFTKILILGDLFFKLAKYFQFADLCALHAQITFWEIFFKNKYFCRYKKQINRNFGKKCQNNYENLCTINDFLTKLPNLCEITHKSQICGFVWKVLFTCIARQKYFRFHTNLEVQFAI